MSNNNKKIGTVKIRTSCVKLLKENFERILVLFAAILEENSSNSLNCDNINTLIIYDVYLSGNDEIVRTISEDLITRLQKYVDDICIEGCNTINNKSSTTTTTGEDSSYDSDCEGYDGGPSQISLGTHQDVSRTTSDTLAEEFAEYVQTTVVPENSPGYNARVEFALKLGYTEKHVQVALQKLGPAPTQNELLAELIKLSAQKGLGGGGGGGASSSCDSSPTESLVSDLGLLDRRFDLVETGPSSTSLRSIVIDGSNVAMSHGNKELFSCRGIKICIDWFQSRGHKDITVFVPKWRKEAPRVDNPIKDQEILAELEKERLLVFTPSRLVFGKRMVCYDDRYILKLAAHTDGVVVSNDNYRDLCQESVEFRKVVEERILMYSFVNDHFMPPDDPLGRAGPTLDNFLRRQPRKGENTGTPPPPPCPYGKKCTYGNKCKYNHPERGPLPHKSVTERLSEHAQRHLQARECKDGGGDIRKNPLGRTRSNIPPPKETQQHTTVSKSRSVDNVGVLSQQLVNQQHHQFSENFQFLPSSSQQDSSQKNYVYPSSSSSSSSQSSQTQAENLHRKLARQLTLNPTAGGDLRLINNNSRRFGPSSPGPAAGRGFLGNNWDVIHHQGVTRIASAPDSYRCSSSSSSQQQQNQNNAPISGWNGMQQQQSPPHPQHGIPPVRHMHRMSSCSDSQLNVWPGPAGQYYQWNSVTTQEDARRKLHYHLAAIFPEEQVIQAMQMYPDETNAQKICAAILAIFSNDKS